MSEDAAVHAPDAPAGQIARCLGGLVVVVATYYVLTRHRPAGDYLALFLSWPHLACAAAFGIVCRGLAPRLAVPLVSSLSMIVLAAFFGWTALLACAIHALAVYVAVVATYRRPPLVEGLTVAAVLAAGLAASWQIRVQWIPFGGVWVYAILRHVSFAVDVRGGPAPTLTSFLYYDFYYPALFQTEQYTDFTAKNLAQPSVPDYARALRRLVLGWLKVTVAVAIPYSFQDVLEIESFFSGWAIVLVVYVKAVVFVTGAYDAIQGVASLHGIRIRENFPGVLLAHNPSMFWRRWRATMTAFFIRYVYIPLGGRNHRSRNIVAVFACSTAWHWIGVPFFGGTAFNPHYLPVLLFGVWNAVIMVVAWRFQAPPTEHETPEEAGYREAKMLATAVFGSMTVMLLSYFPTNADRLLDNLHVLFPLSALGAVTRDTILGG